MATTAVTFRVTGMHCGSCSLLIDDALEDLPGVHSTTTSVKTGRSVVELDLSRSSTADVIAAIAEAGYQAEPTG
ncbi:heavy metal-associated domain-containing protein [Saccharopolyspora sp. NPDC049357]|uniref:heavy-metal-associated domain-containing protein n=1 Tax=Saccharopolyspora sp. NPDC049357 TaxID=3154507 RepID=UPI00342F832F